jgi:hypothetical protein
LTGGISRLRAESSSGPLEKKYVGRHAWCGLLSYPNTMRGILQLLVVTLVPILVPSRRPAADLALPFGRPDENVVDSVAALA